VVCGSLPCSRRSTLKLSVCSAVSAGTAFERCLFGHVVVKSLILFTLTNFSHPSMRDLSRKSHVLRITPRAQIPIAFCGTARLRHRPPLPPDAISCLGAFRPPAAGARG
jgi:hypothetical protein